MIWFACTQCGKVHGRPEGSAGALIFCDCSQSLRIPWESTAEAPEGTASASSTPLAAEPVEAEPALEPIRFEPTSEKKKASPNIALPATRRRAEEPHDPEYCFSHSSEPRAASCADCGLSFCARCVTTFQGQAMCGPCKNYRTRLLQRKPQTTSLALASFLAALAAAPLLLCLLPVILPRQSIWILSLALVPHAFAVAAGLKALTALTANPEQGGRHLALGGISLASTMVVLMTLLMLLSPRLGI